MAGSDDLKSLNSLSFTNIGALNALIEKAVAAMNREVLVGVPEANSARPTGDSNAQIAAIHENGSPLHRIPARPFLRPGISSSRAKIAKALNLAIREAMAGKNMEAGLTRVGLIAQGAIQQKITDGPFVKLSAYTLKMRRQRGNASEKPLIDTGRLRASIQFVIK